MSSLSQTTTSTKAKDIKRIWWHADADDQILGRLSSKVAQLLMGKHKTYYSAHLDCGDYVVITNTDHIAITGKKAKQKTYYRHSGYPGGLRSITFEKQLQKDSRKIIMTAVKNMLPKNKLRANYLKRLKLFPQAEHSYQDKKIQTIK